MTDNLSPKNLANRLNSKTPKFWKKVRNVMILLGTIGGALMSGGAILPPAIATVAPYLLTAGIVGSALPALAKESNQEETEH